ncbi:TatD family hydrolase, partial [Candidatus Parcubacteria bacterium]|nr:TatD family hydrolase [Candidatus Parcubacteria bacterium]
MLVDTHAHIHFDQYADRLDDVLQNAQANGVEAMVCVGVDEHDSAKAVALAQKLPNLYATVGLHPHDAAKGQPALDRIAELARANLLTPHSSLPTARSVVAIGECGLDYFKQYSPRADQERALRFQIELALELGLPMVWHVRDAFDDFFRTVDEYQGLRGIVHCFTGNRTNMERAVERGFYVAFNGIMTFTKDQSQLEAAKACP